MSDYDFHSGDIIKTLEGLLNESRRGDAGTPRLGAIGLGVLCSDSVVG